MRQDNYQETPFCVIGPLGEMSVVLHGIVDGSEVRAFSAEDVDGRPVRIPTPQIPSAVDALIRAAAKKVAS